MGIKVAVAVTLVATDLAMSLASTWAAGANGAAWIVLRYMHVSFMPAIGLSMAVTAVVYIPVASRFREHSYIHGEDTPEEEAVAEAVAAGGA